MHSGGGNIKVVVRCRPLNARELARGATCLVRMDGNQTILSKPGGDIKDVKAFTFDRSYWSVNPEDSDYADQEMVYNDLGRDLLQHAFDGYNCCIFAYGQTGSGKSYSMMGYEDKGIIPRTCAELYDRIALATTDTLSFQVEVSYIEIYNERVRDLLNPRNKGTLKVREHPKLGPYVEDLLRLPVNSVDDINKMMDDGNKARTVAATQMNETSSRSHAVFMIFLTQKRLDLVTNTTSEKVARISLVDLAGSERANSTGATGTRLKEGANINKSLTTLGKVIAGLAEASNQEANKRLSKKPKESFIPYRDSVLTWLLKDSLGGNSKTAMMAAISPADYDETLSTLRYADQAKKIRNKAVVNEDPNARLIRELKDELQALRDTLSVIAPEELDKITVTSSKSSKRVSAVAGNPRPPPREFVYKDTSGAVKHMSKTEVIEQLQASEKLLNDLNQTWEEKLKKAEEAHTERVKALEEMGVMVENGVMGVYAPKKLPHLVNLNEDPLMSECLLYPLKPGLTRVGCLESEAKVDIRLSGPNIRDEHCIFENADGAITIVPMKNAMTMVNGMRISDAKRLRSGFRVILGDHHVFRFNNPEEARKERDMQRVAASRPESPASPTTSASVSDLESTPEVIDWNYARREAVLNYYSAESNFGGLTDEDLEKLFDDISKLRLLRKRKSDGKFELDDDTLSRTSTSSTRPGTISTAPTMFDDRISIDTNRLSIDTEEILRQAKEEMQQQLELQKQEYEEPYESKIKRISLHLPPGTVLNTPVLPSDVDTENIGVARKAIAQWRKLRYISMAEAVLSNAIIIKEANVISKELGKDVIYQFTIVHDQPSAIAQSFWESTTSLQPFGKTKDAALTEEAKPCIGVLVIDKQHRVTYVWSLDKLKRRLQLMRSLYDFNEQPLYRKHHFNRQDPFYENPCPRFTLIGHARLSLRNLAFQIPVESIVDVFCRNTCTVMGQLKVLIAPIARSVPKQTPGTPTTPSSTTFGAAVSVANQSCLLHVGQQLVFEIQILMLTGIHESRFNQVHAQFRASGLGNSADRVYATDPISDFGNSPIRFKHSQTISTVVTSELLDTILHDALNVEIFGQAQTEYLLDRVEWDLNREEEKFITRSQPVTSPTYHGNQAENGSNDDGTLAAIQRILDHRRPSMIERNCHDSGFLSEERHDVVASIEICELTPSGEYSPVPVLSGDHANHTFQLRQGLQRRIRLTLTHDSGRQFSWASIKHLTIGNVRLIDADDVPVMDASSRDLSINLFEHDGVRFQRDGTGVISVEGPWDSSLHNSLFLNRAAQPRQQVLVSLHWEIECENCTTPLAFETDLAIQVQDRDANTASGMLRTFLGGSGQPQTRKATAFFVVHLKPPLTRNVRDLWRLNTANKYVRGEELLGAWRPRSVALVDQYRHNRQMMYLREAVASTKQILSTMGSGPLSQRTSDMSKEDLLRKVVSLWLSKPNTAKDIVISDEVCLLAIGSPTTRSPSKAPERGVNLKLIPQIYQIAPSVTVAKCGYLMQPKDAGDCWVKRWFVLRRPFILVYENQSEATLLAALNLTSVRVDYKKDLEEMLQKPNSFAVYTVNNAYLFQAMDYTDMIDWISKIDQFYPVDAITKDI
ncbi:hypothetical protein BX666DRAFT_1869635 [Dichotomocladium elegans]|nr:hypothetical protein BX666DRAFT_1869635 [Dichotomocladium elegans]